jgi:hypothetical protein
MAMGQERSPLSGWRGRARLNRSGNQCPPPAMVPKLSGSLATGRRLLVANFNKGEPEGSVTTFLVERTGELSDRQGPFGTGGAEPDFGGLIIVPQR